MLTSSEEDDWTICGSDSTEGTTTACVTVKLGDDHRTNSHSFLESLCLLVTRLTDTTVHDEDSSIWCNSLLDLNHFIK